MTKMVCNFIVIARLEILYKLTLLIMALLFLEVSCVQDEYFGSMFRFFGEEARTPAWYIPFED